MTVCLPFPSTGGSRVTRRSTSASSRMRRSVSSGVSDARWASARCWRTSATISTRRGAGTPSAASRASIASCHEGSGILEARDAVDGEDEVLPAAALGGQHLAAERRELVVAAPALAGLLDPLPLDPAALLEAAGERVGRRDGVVRG